MWHGIAAALAPLMLFGAPTISHALSCAARNFTLEEAYEEADSIIVGQITECGEEISNQPSWVVRGVAGRRAWHESIEMYRNLIRCGSSLFAAGGRLCV